ncbi:hypothetical protein A3C20_01735 [Candidatus Kaiserbacteria bacterium RIFCSPHIGHO2_02_FULL_55_25]|uniref:DoxX family protein n=1 Tax=Candidatus Kaiserbacteria bacterium RIFCSPHIGHO2_02_FULL_55_25 TaxID=1798498 RepID=A0A1F6E5H8_9BACT|nr:MAG: hypothetical protein A3C20_01735 [Candidatus Kaiserbacteria bacterium RIFCSPHIGHO2_02_FULL_55_25]OGG78241.1 MAG: hypothetical protein A3F56_04210 [Candidatus Kaiserbacteria bacterium RIFCSPHIGHO2_12_FULL_55_13]OGG84151.1 MAG: hypothetical protein A3A42_02045 [Candidatus Kaiserbacteria bacterium RIFCSPLOWO2_01_FULL_55_25]
MLPVFVGALTLPLAASAHEVYVLDHATVLRDIAAQSPNPLTAYAGNEIDFFFWGAVSVATTLAVLFASLYRRVESRFDSLVYRLKRLAHPMVRVTCSVCLIASGYYGALFGPELPFEPLFGSLSFFLQLAFVAGGAMVLVGLFTRYIAALLLALYLFAAIEDGLYLLTYANYIGMFLLLLILGSGIWSLDWRYRFARLPHALSQLARRFDHIAFPVMRVFFGFGLIYASVYAKFLHSQLALDVVARYHLTDYFPFDPLFIVLGALIIEFLAGLFLVIGFEIRWTSLFLLFWLTLSLLYFGEAAWPHLILFGLGLAIFFHGYDRYSLEGIFLKKHKLEPVL